jgi:hypothetical protein
MISRKRWKLSSSQTKRFLYHIGGNEAGIYILSIENRKYHNISVGNLKMDRISNIFKEN